MSTPRVRVSFALGGEGAFVFDDPVRGVFDQQAGDAGDLLDGAGDMEVTLPLSPLSLSSVTLDATTAASGSQSALVVKEGPAGVEGGSTTGVLGGVLSEQWYGLAVSTLAETTSTRVRWFWYDDDSEQLDAASTVLGTNATWTEYVLEEQAPFRATQVRVSVDALASADTGRFWVDDLAVGPVYPFGDAEQDFVELSEDVFGESLSSTSVSIQGSATPEDGRPMVRTGVLSVLDPNRVLDPDNAAGPYFGRLLPGLRLRIDGVIDLDNDGVGFDTPVGTFKAVDFLAEHGPTTTRVRVPFADELSWMNAVDLAEIAPAHSGDLTGERVDRVLDLAGSTAPRFIDAAEGVELGAATFSESAYNHLERVARTEWGGQLFVDPRGVVTFLDRFAAQESTVWLGLSDRVEAIAGVSTSVTTQYVHAERRSAVSLVANLVTSTGTSGNDQAVGAPGSQAIYGVRTFAQRDLLMLSDTVALDHARTVQSRRADPPRQFRRVVIELAGVLNGTGAPSTIAGRVMATTPGKRVVVQQTPAGGDTITETCLVFGVSHDVSLTSWTVTLDVMNASGETYLVFDDDELGKFNTGQFAF